MLVNVNHNLSLLRFVYVIDGANGKTGAEMNKFVLMYHNRR